MNKIHHERGSVLIGSLIVLATLAAMVGITVSKSGSSARVKQARDSSADDEAIRRSVVSSALLKVQQYAWTPSQSLSDLVPTSGNRFKNWGAGGGTYQNVSYTISVGDNYESSETTQNFFADTDNKAYVLVTMTQNGATYKTRVLMSPGKAASAVTSTSPSDVPAAGGVCYGFLNLITMVSLPTGSKMSGYDSLPASSGTCPASPSASDYNAGGACDGSAANDQYGLASTSWLGAVNLGDVFDIGSLMGTVDGLSNPSPGWHSVASAGQPTSSECENYDLIKTTADNLLAAGSSKVRLDQQSGGFLGIGTKTVSGSLTVGTSASPAVLYIKSTMLGKVRYTGSITGYGIMIIDGNAQFDDPVNWNGMVINNANALFGKIADFRDTVNITGGAMIRRPVLSAEYGRVSGDIIVRVSGSNIRYSFDALNTALSSLDPNYVPPGSSAPGQSLSVSSYQEL